MSHRAPTDAPEQMWASGLPIPARLVAAITFLRGEDDGLAWLRGLDRTSRDYADRWRLRLESIALGGAMSCCIFATSADGAPLVLKIPVDGDAGRLEAAVVGLWARTGGAPAVVEADPDAGGFLMSRVLPGDTYTGLDPAGIDGGVAAIVDLANRLGPVTPPDGLPVPDLRSVFEARLEWARARFADTDAAALAPPLDRAADLLGELLVSQAESVLLHADLQAKNVLVGPEGRLYAIDPLCARGERLSDLAMWAVLQDTAVPIDEVLEALSVRANLDLGRLRSWAYVIACLELRPLQPSRFARQVAFIENHVL